jgi:5-formyltetrahydrofolate cyclo-ligase
MIGSQGERKVALRRELLDRRRQRSPESRAAESHRVAERVFAAPELAVARRVFCCLSFGDELDTWPIVERLLASDRELFVPRTTRGHPEIHVHRYPCALETLSFGLVQPRRGEPELAPAEIDRALDLALVAGVGFDRCGYRLGYGAGYFDRFLAGRPFPALGLAFDEQIVAALPVEPHDVAMRAVLTPGARIEGERGRIAGDGEGGE